MSCSTRSTGRSPAECSGCRPTRSARPTTWRPSSWRPGDDTLLVGDGAALREAFEDLKRRRARRAMARLSVGGVARAARPRPALCASSSSTRGTCSRSTCASPTPRSTGRPETARECGTDAAEDARPSPSTSRSPLDARVAHLRRVLRDRAARVPAALVARALRARARARARTHLPRRPGRRARRRLRGLMFVAEDGHITTIAVDPSGTAQLGTRLLLAPARDQPSVRGAYGLTLEVRRRATRRAGALPPVRLRAGRRAQGYYARHRRGRAGDVGPRHRHAATSPGWTPSRPRSTAARSSTPSVRT